MNWLKALDLLIKAHQVKGQHDEIKRVHDYAQKVAKANPEKLKWDDLKFFNDSTMDAATSNARKVLQQIKEAEKSPVEWPRSDSVRAFTAAAGVVGKYGADSAQAKKAVKSYSDALESYGRALKKLDGELDTKTSKLTDTAKTYIALKKYANVVSQAFLKLAKIPSFGGTAQNAMFFSLSQDAQQYGGIVSRILKGLNSLDKKNMQHIKNCKDLIKTNQLWINWSKSKHTSQRGALEKNAEAKLPRK